MIFLLLFFSLTLPLMGQGSIEVVTGQILLNERPPGELASSIQVELNRIDQPGEGRKTIVNAEGEYRFAGLDTGIYIVSAKAPGYKTVKVQVELLRGNQVLGSTKLALLPEQRAPKGMSLGNNISQNELRASRKAIKQVEAAERALDEGKLEVAARALDKTLTEYPQYARALFQQGRLLEKQGKIREAITSYEKTIAEDTGYEAAYRALADIYRSASDRAGLRIVMDQWKKNQPSEVAPYFYSAVAYYESGEYQRALDEALLASRFPHDNFPRLHLVLANCYNKLHDPQAAAVQMREFLERCPDDLMASQVRSSLQSIQQYIPK